MDLRDFTAVTADFWSRNLKIVSAVLHSPIGAGRVILFPTMLICTETENHFIAELFGATDKYGDLEVKSRSSRFNEYFAQFPLHNPPTALRMGGRNNAVDDQTYTCDVDAIEEAAKRFPVLGRTHTTYWHGNIDADLDTRSCFLNRCSFLNSNGELFRSKHIIQATITGKGTMPDGLSEDLYTQYGIGGRSYLRGGISVSNRDLSNASNLVGQVQSLYLMPHLHETTIGAIIQSASRNFPNRTRREEPTLGIEARMDDVLASRFDACDSAGYVSSARGWLF